jgi:hypothetical protein
LAHMHAMMPTDGTEYLMYRIVIYPVLLPYQLTHAELGRTVPGSLQ